MDINEINKQIAELDGQISSIKQKAVRRINGIKLKQEKLKQKKNQYLLNMLESAGIEELSSEQLQQVFEKISEGSVHG